MDLSFLIPTAMVCIVLSSVLLCKGLKQAGVNDRAAETLGTSAGLALIAIAVLAARIALR